MPAYVTVVGTASAGADTMEAMTAATETTMARRGNMSARIALRREARGEGEARGAGVADLRRCLVAHTTALKEARRARNDVAHQRRAGSGEREVASAAGRLRMYR